MDTTITDEPTEPRSFAAIANTLEDTDPGAILAPLTAARRKLDMHLSGVEAGADAWRHTLDEATPALGEVERETLDSLEHAARHLRAGRDQLALTGYRSGLPPYERDKASALAGHLLPRLAALGAEAIARELRGAVLAGNRIELGAWALLADAIDARFPAGMQAKDSAGRNVPARHLFGPDLDHCQRVTGDPALLELRDNLDAKIRDVNDAIGDLTRRRVIHEPSGNFGSPLLSFQFGVRPDRRQAVAQSKRYDPAAVAARLGKG